MDIKEKLIFARVDSKDFVPDGQTESVKYYQLVLGVGARGELLEVPIKLTPSIYNNLKLADDKPKIDIHSQE